CIFGLGAPEDYLSMSVDLKTGMELVRNKLLARLVDMQYERNDIDFHRGVFRVRGDRVEIYPSYEEERAVRIDFFGDQVEAVSKFDPLRGVVTDSLKRITIYPASHYVADRKTLEDAVKSISDELKERIDYFRNENKLIEAQRIEERTNFDLEMMLELGYCNG
ncbi:MAG: excinuclease ABC subunit B, partial [Proteobacteria bacterium]|nr:excinuclease ABC subunit B [Pseudomonadota bacterium]